MIQSFDYSWNKQNKYETTGGPADSHLNLKRFPHLIKTAKT